MARYNGKKIPNEYNNNSFSVARVFSALKPDRFQFIDSTLAWLGVPVLIALGTWLSRIASMQADALANLPAPITTNSMALTTTNALATTQPNPLLGLADKQLIDNLHTTLVVSQFVFLAAAILRLAKVALSNSNEMNQFLIENHVYSAEDFKKFQKDPRQFLRVASQLLQAAGVITCGCFIPYSEYMVPAGIGLIASTLIFGNFADLLARQARMMSAKHTLKDNFRELQNQILDQASGWGYKFALIFTIPSIIALSVLNSSQIAKDSELLKIILNTVSFGSLAIASSYPGVTFRIEESKYHAQQIQSVDHFKDTRPEVTTRPTPDFGRQETNTGAMNITRHSAALLAALITAAVLNSQDLDSPLTMLTVSVLPGILYLLLTSYHAQQADVLARLQNHVTNNPLLGVRDGIFTHCYNGASSCFNRSAGYDVGVGEEQHLLDADRADNRLEHK